MLNHLELIQFMTTLIFIRKSSKRNTSILPEDDALTRLFENSLQKSHATSAMLLQTTLHTLHYTLRLRL